MKKQIVFMFLFIFSISMVGQDRITGKLFASRSEVIAKNGMAATSHPLATQAALEILKQGGNAIDAAIAANSVLGLVEPTGNGIGGDLFAIIWDSKSKKLYGLDASGYAPGAAKLEYFLENGIKQVPPYGPLPVTVPGCVAGWGEMHKKFGKLKWSNLFVQAISYARDGFPMSELVAYYMELSSKNFNKYLGYVETYMIEGHSPLKGEVFKNPNLAKTLEKIANGGPDTFYKGDIARIIADFIQS